MQSNQSSGKQILLLNTLKILVFSQLSAVFFSLPQQQRVICSYMDSKVPIIYFYCIHTIAKSLRWFLSYTTLIQRTIHSNSDQSLLDLHQPVLGPLPAFLNTYTVSTKNHPQWLRFLLTAIYIRLHFLALPSFHSSGTMNHHSWLCFAPADKFHLATS